MPPKMLVPGNDPEVPVSVASVVFVPARVREKICPLVLSVGAAPYKSPSLPWMRNGATVFVEVNVASVLNTPPGVSLKTEFAPALPNCVTP